MHTSLCLRSPIVNLKKIGSNIGFEIFKEFLHEGLQSYRHRDNRKRNDPKSSAPPVFYYTLLYIFLTNLKLRTLYSPTTTEAINPLLLYYISFWQNSTSNATQQPETTNPILSYYISFWQKSTSNATQQPETANPPLSYYISFWQNSTWDATQQLEAINPLLFYCISF